MKRTKVVGSIADEALDVSAMDAAGTLKDYIATRDKDLEIVVPGCVLTRFHTNPIKQSVLDNYVLAATTEEERIKRAFRCGVSRIENLVSAQTLDVITVMDPAANVSGAGRNTGKMFDDEQLEDVQRAFKDDIGSVCLTRSFLAGRSEAPYQVPLFLLTQIALSISRHADENQTTQTQENTEAT